MQQVNYYSQWKKNEDFGYTANEFRHQLYM